MKQLNLFILATGLLLVSQQAMAYKQLGLMAGLNWASIESDNDVSGYTGTSAESAPGFGAFLSLPIKDSGMWGLEIGITYAPKSFELDASGDKIEHDNLTEYFMIRYRQQPDSPFNFGVGLYVSQAMGDATVTDGTSGAETETSLGNLSGFGTEGISEEDYGAITSMQVIGNLTESMGVLIDIRYVYGLRDINEDKTSGFELASRQIQGFAGLSFKFD